MAARLEGGRCLLRLRIPGSGGEDGAEKRPKTKVAGRRHSAAATLSGLCEEGDRTVQPVERAS